MKRRLEEASAAFTKASLASSYGAALKKRHDAVSSEHSTAQPSSRGPLSLGSSELDELSEDERRALRASRFARDALPPPASKAAPPPSRRAVLQAHARDARSGSPSTESAPRCVRPFHCIWEETLRERRESSRDFEAISIRQPCFKPVPYTHCASSLPELSHRSQ